MTSKLPGSEPVVAEAAHILSEQSRVQLARLSRLIQPHVTELDSRFRRRLGPKRLEERHLKALSNITLGAAAQIMGEGRALSEFFEQVEYSGRRLAKLNLSPSKVIQALREYDRVLDPFLSKAASEDAADYERCREQLQLCVALTLNHAYYQVSAAETEALYNLFHAELQSRNLDELLQQFLTTLTGTVRAQAGRLLLLDAGLVRSQAAVAACNGELPQTGRISAQLLRRLSKPIYIAGSVRGRRRKGAVNAGYGEHLILDPSLRRAPYRSYWSIPLIEKGRTAGLLQFAFHIEYEWLPRELQLLETAAERCLQAAEKARLVEDLARRERQIRELSEHMLQVEEEERRRLSRELHDEAGQSLLFIRLQLEMIEKTLPIDLADVRAKVSETRQVAERTVMEIRRIIAALSPAVLEQLGLAAAVRQLTTRFRRIHAARVRLKLNGRFGRLPREAETITYRLVQECYQNIAKHSLASNVNLSLRSTDHSLELIAEDDGVGFLVGPALEKRDSFGLAGMRQRVVLLGGQFEIDSQPNQGTKVSIKLPISNKRSGQERAYVNN